MSNNLVEKCEEKPVKETEEIPEGFVRALGADGCFRIVKKEGTYLSPHKQRFTSKQDYDHWCDD
jgi:hypothetical protein